MSLLAPGLAWLARVLGHWLLCLLANLSSIKNYVQDWVLGHREAYPIAELVSIHPGTFPFFFGLAGRIFLFFFILG